MTLKIEHSEISKLAQELAHTTGETVSEAIMTARRERLEREQARQRQTT